MVLRLAITATAATVNDNAATPALATYVLTGTTQTDGRIDWVTSGSCTTSNLC